MHDSPSSKTKWVQYGAPTRANMARDCEVLAAIFTAVVLTWQRASVRAAFAAAACLQGVATLAVRTQGRERHKCGETRCTHFSQRGKASPASPNFPPSRRLPCTTEDTIYLAIHHRKPSRVEKSSVASSSASQFCRWPLPRRALPERGATPHQRSKPGLSAGTWSRDARVADESD